jgi:hypothetical protein
MLILNKLIFLLQLIIISLDNVIDQEILEYYWRYNICTSECMYGDVYCWKRTIWAMYKNKSIQDSVYASFVFSKHQLETVADVK